MNFKNWFNIKEGLQRLTAVDSSKDRYRLLQRNIRILMIVLTIVPLSMMALINYHQYQKSLKEEIINPETLLANKTRHSFEFFLNERQSLIKSISYFYSYDQLSDKKTLNHILFTLKKEFGGFGRSESKSQECTNGHLSDTTGTGERFGAVYLVPQIP